METKWLYPPTSVEMKDIKTRQIRMVFVFMAEWGMSLIKCSIE
jgi:hypothetical protein